jgi:ankyrin repeat protein
MAMKLVSINLFDSIRTNRVAEVSHCLRSGSSANTRSRGYEGLPDGWSPLHQAVAIETNPLITKILIKNGAKCNYAVGVVGTPLHITSQLEVAQILIASGSDLSAKNAMGETPLESQVRLGHTDIVELLRQHATADEQDTVDA